MWNFQTKYPFKNHKKSLAIGIFAGFLVILGGILIVNSLQPARAKDGDDKIITVFEGETRKSFISKAKTVGEALKLEGIEIAPEDNVEPELSEKLTGADYNINIFRAKPYLIQDGEKKIRVLTANKVPSKIVTTAGVQLLENDLVQFSHSKTLLEDGTTGILQVIRAKEIRVKIFGQEKTFRTQSARIADFLKEKKIKQDKDLWVSKDLKSQIKNGDYFEIARNGVQTISQDEIVAFPIEKIQDGEKPVGYKEIKEAGENGSKTVVYEVDFQNGKEISRKKISEVETKKAKKQVEVVGVKGSTPIPTAEQSGLLSAAGIPASEHGNATYLVNKESRWNPSATNRSSGAYGLPQALPGSKMASAGADWQTNPVTQLRWMNGYVLGRYGSWANAVAHSRAKGWY